MPEAECRMLVSYVFLRSTFLVRLKAVGIQQRHLPQVVSPPGRGCDRDDAVPSPCIISLTIQFYAGLVGSGSQFQK